MKQCSYYLPDFQTQQAGAFLFQFPLAEDVLERFCCILILRVNTQKGMSYTFRTAFSCSCLLKSAQRNRRSQSAQPPHERWVECREEPIRTRTTAENPQTTSIFFSFSADIVLLSNSSPARQPTQFHTTLIICRLYILIGGSHCIWNQSSSLNIYLNLSYKSQS